MGVQPDNILNKLYIVYFVYHTVLVILWALPQLGKRKCGHSETPELSVYTSATEFHLFLSSGPRHFLSVPPHESHLGVNMFTSIPFFAPPTPWTIGKVELME